VQGEVAPPPGVAAVIAATAEPDPLAAAAGAAGAAVATAQPPRGGRQPHSFTGTAANASSDGGGGDNTAADHDAAQERWRSGVAGSADAEWTPEDEAALAAGSPFASISVDRSGMLGGGAPHTHPPATRQPPPQEKQAETEMARHIKALVQVSLCRSPRNASPTTSH